MAYRVALEEVLVMVGKLKGNRMARLSFDLADRSSLLLALRGQKSKKNQTN